MGGPHPVPCLEGGATPCSVPCPGGGGLPPWSMLGGTHRCCGQTKLKTLPSLILRVRAVKMQAVTNLIVVPDTFVSHRIYVLSINCQQHQLPLQWLHLHSARRLFTDKVCFLWKKDFLMLLFWLSFGQRLFRYRATSKLSELHFTWILFVSKLSLY